MMSNVLLIHYAQETDHVNCWNMLQNIIVGQIHWWHLISSQPKRVISRRNKRHQITTNKNMVHSWKCSNICLKILSSIAWINHYHLIIYPLIAKVVRWFQNQFPPFFPILNCPLGPGELQACLIHNVFCPPLPLSALSSSPFYCTCKMVFARSEKKEKKNHLVILDQYWPKTEFVTS